MLNHSEVDRVFQALADTTRREMIERLVRGPASVGELAEPLDMSLPAVMQHLRVLENCGLVRSEKHGRVRTCQVETAPLRAVESWLASQRTEREKQLDALGDLLSDSAPTDDHDHDQSHDQSHDQTSE